MNLNDKLFEYLAKKIPTFSKVTKGGEWLFTCPNLVNHKFKSRNPTATFIPNTDKIHCLICGFKGTMFDAVRILEEDKKYKSDAEITSHLIGELNLDMYKELNIYEKYGWALIPLLQNSKTPFEKGWQESEHKDKTTWIKWLNNNLNIGLNCGKSKVTVIDIDLKVSPAPELEEIYKSLHASQTLIQSTPHGKHFIFLQDLEIPQDVDFGGLHIDTRNIGGQIVLAPSRVEGKEYRFINLGVEIKKIPEEIKQKLLSFKQVDKGRKEIEIPQTQKINEGEGRNDLLTSLGGVLINKFAPDDTAYILSLVSKNFFNPPLPYHEIKAMLGSLSSYKMSEEISHEKAIYEYLKLLQNDVSAKDIMESLRLPRAIIDKYLSKFVKEGKAIRLGRGRYQYREKIEWTDRIPEIITEYTYKIPLFNNIAIFQEGDVILLGARTNDGKTTIALNMVKEMINQNVKPYYIYSEAGSRFQKISKMLEIDGKFYHSWHENPLAIELEADAFTIIDWLHLENKAETDTVLKHLNDEVQRKRGILVIFTQIKQTYEFFAPNLIDHFPTFAAKYIQDTEQKTEGHFDISKIKEPRGNFTTYILPCEYNHNTKIFKVKDLI